MDTRTPLSRRLGKLGAAVTLASAMVIAPFAPATAAAAPAPAGIPSDDPRVQEILAQDDNLEYLGTPVTTQIPSQAAQGIEDGRHVSYQTFKGAADTDYPATFAVTDVESGEQLFTCPILGAEHVRNLDVASDGRVYMGTYYDSKVWRYDPATRTCEDLGTISDGTVADHAFGVSPGPDGSMYLGVYPDSRLYLVDPETDEIELLREMDPGAEYIHGISYHPETDTVYVGTGGVRPQIWKVTDGGRGEQTLIADEANAPGLGDGGATTVGRMDIVGDRIFAQVGLRMLILDLDGNVIHWDADQTRFFFGHHIIPGAEPGTALFSTEGWNLVEYNIADNTFRDTGINPRGYMSNGIVDDSSGTPILYGTSSLGVFTADLSTDTMLTDNSIDFAQPTLIQKVLNGPDDTIFASGYMVGLSQVDKTGADHGITMQRGQYESAVVRDGKMYLGAYGHAKFEELDPQTWDPSNANTVPRLFESADQGQDRPHGMAYNPDRDEVYMGSVAIYGQTQGGLVIWEGATGEHTWLTTEIGVDENVVSVVFNPTDQLVYIGTTVDGGLGSVPSGNTAGKLIIFDPATREVVRTLDPVGEEREGITGLTVADDGRVWGVGEEALFVYDPATGTSTVESTSVGGRYGSGTQWAYANMNQSAKDGKLYITAGQRFSVHDPATGETTRIATGGVGWSTVDEEGDVYLSAGAHLFRYNVPAAVVCDTTITEDHAGPLTVTEGVTCVEGATLRGPIRVSDGAGLRLTDATVRGPISTTGASEVTITDSDLRGPLMLEGTTGDLEIRGSTIAGPVRVNGSTGPAPIIAGTSISGGLACSGNADTPTDEGDANTVRGPASGDCAALG